MVTSEDVLRMQDQEDVDRLIQVLQGDSDPLLRGLAAKALGDLGGPRARDALKSALLSGEPLVMAQASTALGQLEANIATGARRRKKKPKVLKKIHQKGFRGMLWKLLLVIGIIFLCYGLLAGSTIFIASDSFILVNYILVVGCLIGFGLLFIYLSTRPIKPMEPTEN